jgi:hypothetical protein
MEINLSILVKYLFTEREKYKYISQEDKDKWGFIINRMLSKKYPDYAQKLNVRQGDWGIVLDLWWLYLGYKSKNYHPWVWPVKGSPESKVNKKDIELIQSRFPWITIKDIEYLYNWYSEDFKSELKYYKKIQEDYGDKQ